MLPSQLKILDLSMNAIVEIPSGISAFKRLKKLTMTDNKLEALPDLSELKVLETAIFDRNKISSIAELPKSLKVLALSSNRFTAFPEAIKELAKLEKLILSKNSIEGELPGMLMLSALMLDAYCVYFYRLVRGPGQT